MTCPKNYSLPTSKWLKPLEVLYNENNLVLTADLINEIKKEKVIVKIIRIDSFLDRKDTQKIYKIIKNSKHIVKIYCFLICNENESTLTNEYKNALGFCSGNKGSQIISLEIMKKYKKSLHFYEKKLSIEEYHYILKYLLLMQLELFNLYGFVHCDIHLGNFLIGKTKEDEVIFNVSSHFDPVRFIPLKI